MILVSVRERSSGAPWNCASPNVLEGWIRTISFLLSMAKRPSVFFGRKFLSVWFRTIKRSSLRARVWALPLVFYYPNIVLTRPCGSLAMDSLYGCPGCPKGAPQTLHVNRRRPVEAWMEEIFLLA
jgi:hypothetical protein